jgi:phosphate transport system substrate-binding protein
MNDEEKYYRGFLGFLTHRWIIYVLVCLIIIILLIPFAATYITNIAKCGKITIAGSTALLPLVNQSKEAYMNQECSSAKIIVQASGSKDGLNQIEKGKVDIGTSDIFADPTNKYLQDHQVAIVVFALVIHKDKALASITNLSTQQIQSIYGGAFNNWGQVNSVMTTPPNIIVVSRPPTSGTRATFGMYVLKGVETVSGSQVGDKSDDVAQFVCKTSGAIGYISLFYYYQHNGCLQLLSIDTHAPTPENVENNTYMFWNIEHMYTQGQPTGLTENFIKYMYTDTIKMYIKQYDQYGYLDMNNIPKSVLATHLSL